MTAKTRVLGVVLGVGILLIGAGLQQGQEKTGTKQEPKSGDQKQMTDEQFVVKATQVNLAEINLGRIAVERASAAQVKDYANQMVKAHSAANDQLLGIANKKKIGITPSQEANQKYEALKNNLLQRQGADFDREYMETMAKGHTKAVALYEQESKNGKDEDVKRYAATLLPTVQEHLKAAENLCQTLRKDAKKDAK